VQGGLPRLRLLLFLLQVNGARTGSVWACDKRLTWCASVGVRNPGLPAC
jgi:hypothetical protein